MTDAALQAIVDQRLAGDRTGACMAVAVVEPGGVARTFRSADPQHASRIDAKTAFEIGSVSKTMAAVLLADLVLQGKASLEDPLAAYLPDGTVLPDFDGQPILLRHLVTHTSGLPSLPSRMGEVDLVDPYVALTEEALLASLEDVVLSSAPGTHYEYSNFASMVLSSVIARRADSDFETLLKQRLFTPLGMAGAYVNEPPMDVRVASGHLPNGLPTSAWHFANSLSGVGGVRATLDDMVRYLQGNLGLLESSITPALELAQQVVSERPPMAMNWMLAEVEGRIVHMHEGGTGGFSSFVAVDRERRRGVVILCDTTWNSIGGLESLGMHLVDASFPLGRPRTLQAPSQVLLDDLAGQYQLQGMMQMALRAEDGRLFVQPAGQAEFEMGYDSAGDFFPLAFDALLQPRKKPSGEQAFVWAQGGGAVPADRIVVGAGKAPALPAAVLAGYVGEYVLMPGFVLSVRASDGCLHAQASGQGEFQLHAMDPDHFEAPGLGIDIVFRRDAGNGVCALDLYQGGNVLSGQRG